MSLPPRGMPILSGAPPLVESQDCRQCGRDFNPLWRRSKACGHCGYEYCSTCMSDGQALMPRRDRPSSHGPLSDIREALLGDSHPTTPGYDPEPVCIGCLVMLQVTAAPVDTLRSLPLKRLKSYLTAYDIPVIGVKEKEDLVLAAVQARDPATGCLFPEHESYYRRKSVPKRGRLPSANATSNGARPSPNNQQRPNPPHTARPPPPNNARPPPPHYAQNRPPPRQQAPPRPQPPRPAAPAQPRSPPARPPPIPSISSLAAFPRSYLSTLSIGTLKAILYENHVRVDFKQVLEKEELVTRVFELVTDERKRLERRRLEEERELEEQRPSASPPSEGLDSAAKPAPSGPAPNIDQGLCVVCQDEEATLAVVDCGHLAMCQPCSDLIMATSKECPLCRTRIITPQRLIRIYRS